MAQLSVGVTMSVNKNKLKAAISRLSKALQNCNELGLKLAQLQPMQVQVGDHVLHDGSLQKVVARDPAHPNRLAFEDGVIRDMPATECLVLRG